MSLEKINKGLVFSNERYAIHNGPGIRTIVFLKGGPLNYLWCTNPEGQNSTSTLAILPEKCIGCGRFVEVCPTLTAYRIGRTFFGNLQKGKINSKYSLKFRKTNYIK